MTIKEIKILLAWCDVDVVRILDESNEDSPEGVVSKEYRFIGTTSPYEQFIIDESIDSLVLSDVYSIGFGYISEADEKILAIWVIKGELQ